MDDFSNFESRRGKLTCSAEELFEFITDIRNFEQFIPAGILDSWHSDKESCSFNVSMLGSVSLRLAEKQEYNKVIYEGDALKKNDFSLKLAISGEGKTKAEVLVSLKAELNPMMKMVVSKPITGFLEVLINEMEKFSGWRDTKV